MCTKRCISKLRVVWQAWLPGREIVEQCLLQRHSVHPSGAVFELSQYCPWKEHLYDLERKHGIEGQLKFCLYQVLTACWLVLLPSMQCSVSSSLLVHQ